MILFLVTKIILRLSVSPLRKFALAFNAYAKQHASFDFKQKKGTMAQAKETLLGGHRTKEELRATLGKAEKRNSFNLKQAGLHQDFSPLPFTVFPRSSAEEQTQGGPEG